MINININNGGIYKAFILSDGVITKIYIPSLITGTDNCPINDDGTLNIEIFQKNKDLYLTPLWCIPNLEALKHEQVHPCWVVFENGDINRPIIMGFVGKGIMYTAIVISENSDSESNESNDGGNSDANYSDTAPEASDSGFVWPTTSDRITSKYGNRNKPNAKATSNHRGIDIGVASGSNVYAASGGTVTTARYSNSYGYYVEIQHANGYKTLYAHNSKLNVSVGDTVSAGQVIAKSGSTGNSTGPHLHFEVSHNGSRINPENLYK